MLPNHAPLIVAEQFALLEAYAPGRIDLGIGRAPGSDPVVSAVLGRAAADAVDDFPNSVQAVGAVDDPTRRDRSAGRRPRPTTCGRRRRRPPLRRSGCSDRPTTRRLWPRRWVCRTSSPPISLPARAPSERSTSTGPTSAPHRHWPNRSSSSPRTPSSPTRSRKPRLLLDRRCSGWLSCARAGRWT